MFNIISGGINTKDIYDYYYIIKELKNKKSELKKKEKIRKKLNNCLRYFSKIQ